MLVNVVQAYTSLGRLDMFLQEEETRKFSQCVETSDAPVVGFVDGSFAWVNESTVEDDGTFFKLEQLNLSFPAGKLSIVLGPGTR